MIESVELATRYIITPWIEMRRFSYLTWLQFLNIANGSPTLQFFPQENVEVLPLLQRENRVRGTFAFCPDLVSTKKSIVTVLNGPVFG